MPKQKRRSDLPDQNELSINPSIWLRWYEQHLRQLLKDWAKSKSCNREDLELVLFDRSDLERSIQANPKTLTLEERKKLKELDEQLKKLAPAIRLIFPNISEIQRSLGISKSHWWWFLGSKQ